MRAIGLVVALVLLAWGLYRLFMEERAASRRRGRDGSRDGGSAPKPRESAPGKAGAPAAKARESAPGKAGEPAAKARESAPGKAGEPAAKARESAPGKVEAGGGKAVQNGTKAEGGNMLPSMLHETDADEDITIITLAPSPQIVAAMNALAAKAAAAKAEGAPDAAARPAANVDKVPAATGGAPRALPGSSSRRTTTTTRRPSRRRPSPSSTTRTPPSTSRRGSRR